MSTGARRIIRRAAAAALVTGLLGWIAWQLWRDASSMDWAALRPSPLPLAGAALVLLGAYLFRASLWNHVLRSMGEEVRTRDGWRVFLGAQLGRYLPGKVWQIAGASLMAERYGVSGAAAGTATLVAVMIHHLVGGAFALFALEGLADDLAWTGGAVALAGVIGLAFLASPLFAGSLRWLASATGRASLAKVEPPAPRALLVVTPGYALVWLAFAGALLLVAHGLFPGLPWIRPHLALGAMAAAAVAGFAVLIAPSGLGVREAVLVTLLGPSIGVVPATMTALALRIWMTVVELSLSLWGAWPHLRARRAEKA
ncbi:MAG: lysylphosphatidylglycerol synthase domain-containing protein [Sandaracinaceae bacterium]